MSVNLNSKDGTVSENVSNGTWLSIVALARAYNPEIPGWNCCHDGYEWTPEHLTIMADRLEQAAQLVPLLRELSEHGGVIIS